TLIAGVAATGWEAVVARRERGRADRRFNEVRKLARTFMFDYNDAVTQLPGSTDLRRKMVKDALDYLNSLSAESGGDPLLQQELAEAYIKIGDVQGRTALPSLGDTTGAAENYKKAVVILEALNRADHQNATINHAL